MKKPEKIKILGWFLYSDIRMQILEHKGDTVLPIFKSQKTAREYIKNWGLTKTRPVPLYINSNLWYN